MRDSALGAVGEALRDLRRAQMVAVRDEEGAAAQLVIAAGFADADAINFMAKEARGIICLALTPERCEELGLELITGYAGEREEAKAFMVSIEAREGVTTGISAGDRARTIAVAIDPRSGESEICTPGHVFPLRARPGGVLERPGEAEVAVDLIRAADLYPAAVVCGIIDDEGSPMRGSDLEAYCERHRLRLVSIAQVVALRQASEDDVPTALNETESVP